MQIVYHVLNEPFNINVNTLEFENVDNVNLPIEIELDQYFETDFEGVLNNIFNIELFEIDNVRYIDFTINLYEKYIQKIQNNLKKTTTTKIKKGSYTWDTTKNDIYIGDLLLL